MKKTIGILLTIFCMISLFFTNVNATLVLPNHRWAKMTYYLHIIYQCNLKTNNDNLNTNWNNVYSTAISNWNNNSDYKVAIVDTVFSSSDVDLQTYNGTVAEFESIYGVDTIGITLTMNNATHPGKICAYDYPNCATRIKYAGIILTPKNSGFGGYYTLTTNDRTKVMVHEIGHVVALGHEVYPVVSIMRQGVPYDHTTPQTADRNDLATYYTQLYT